MALRRFLLFFFPVFFFLIAPAASPRAQSTLNPGFKATGEALTPAERAGREIWFFATANNARFFTYSYPQRLGGAIDWFRVLGADRKDDLFPVWGAIADPDCRKPGEPGSPVRSLDETYGFQWCPGDDVLLSYVGRPGYERVDPACDFVDAPPAGDDPHGKPGMRQNACDLRFGTSTGVLGLRKFPNPRFDAGKWRALNGSAGSWEGYARMMAADPANPDSRKSRLFDGSIEPPFLIGMSCGACHITLDAANPPANPARPEWANIDGLQGNDYSQISALLGSGMPKTSIEWQLIARSRPGTVDTSALPMDTVNNPGTFNAIINFARRPVHEQRMVKWHEANACAAGADPAACWCEPGKPSKCWERRLSTEMVPAILKGGEDSIGVNEAIQRVYFNIGASAEQCWLNHIPDLRSVDPAQRNYGQTPFDIAQCRRDSTSFRAIEDRLDDVKAFFLAARPTDLWRARGLASPEALEEQLDKEFFPGAVERGREVFAVSCASCHSSQPGPHDNADFLATDPADPTLRLDWMGNDEAKFAGEIGTYTGRALHSNHMPTRVWAQYAALSLWERPADPGLPEIHKGSGRGYYRNISLLSVWAHAPFMHNNAVGPDTCGKPADPAASLYSPAYVDANGKPLVDPPPCTAFDPSVEGRYALYKASMEALLNPDRRVPKMRYLDRDVIVDIAPRLEIGSLFKTSLTMKARKGMPAGVVSNLLFKDLIQDAILRKEHPDRLDAKYAGMLTPAQYADLTAGLDGMRRALIANPKAWQLDLVLAENAFVQRFYSTNLDRIENSGHRFGEDLSPEDKRALTAFMAQL